MNECGYAMPSIWQRLMWRMFPHAPRPELPGDERTYLTTEVRVNVDWPDRLRVFVRGRIHVQIRTYTDVEVHDATSVSTFSVE